MSSVTAGMQTQCSLISELVWKWVRRLRMPDGRVCYVDGVVRSAGNDVQNVVADDYDVWDWNAAVYQILRRFVPRHRWTIAPRMYRTRSVTSSQCKSACRIYDSPRSYLCVPLMRRAVAFSTRWCVETDYYRAQASLSECQRMSAVTTARQSPRNAAQRMWKRRLTLRSLVIKHFIQNIIDLFTLLTH